LSTATRHEIERVFALQREHRWVAKKSDASRRRELLERLRAAVIDHREEAIHALHADLGKPRGAGEAEVAVVLDAIDQATAHLGGWMQPEDRGESAEFPGARRRVIREARGVVIVFGPWNFPFQLLFEMLVPTLAAGNVAMVRPNEMCPATSRISAEVIRAAFEERDVAVFEGGVEVANAMLDMPIDHVFFTGSPTVGKIVMAAAAKHLASVTLELGGKCPVIIDGTTDLHAAAELVSEGRHFNSGQICLATDHVWIRREAHDEFLRHYLEILDRRYFRDGSFDPSTTSRMVDERNAARVRGYIDDAVERGATLLRGGRSADERTIEPTVLLNVSRDARVMQEEIFGPVLPLLPYDDISEVVEALRDGDKPLALYLFSADEELVEHVLQATSSGGVTVNGWASHWGDYTLPFGGVGHSGSGRYHGVHGFHELSHERPVIVHPATDDSVLPAWSTRGIVGLASESQTAPAA